MSDQSKSELVRACIFCGSTPTTQEHLFGSWLGKQISIPEKREHIRFQESSRGRTQENRGGIAQSVTIKSVCAYCNNGWMSVIENAAQHLLLRLMRGEVESLDRHQQLSISVWVVLKAMIWESQNYVDLKHIPQSDRDFLFQNRVRAGWQVPPNWIVWCGKTDCAFGDCGAIGSARLVVREYSDGSIWPYPIDTSSMSMSFGVFSGNFTAIAFRSPFTANMSIGLRDEVFRRIHPFQEATDWPPPEVFPLGAMPVVIRGIIDDLREAINASGD